MPGVISQLPAGKMSNYGIETSSGLIWTGWEPGKEYIKNLVLKNLRVKTQKMKYKNPSSRFFTTMYPKPFMLTAGNTFTLPITFCPLERTNYDGFVEFETQEGCFSVPMRAILPVHNIEVPPSLNCGMCAVSDCLQISFEIRNTSELVTPFQLDSVEPFTFFPTEGTLEPFASCALSVTFRPKSALVYQMNLVVRYGPAYTHCKAIDITGRGKYPHVSISCPKPADCQAWGEKEAFVNFGPVSVGQSVDRWIVVNNNSPVNAPFHITPLQIGAAGLLEQPFICRQKEGIIPALKSLKIPISYKARDVGMTSTSYFVLHPVSRDCLANVAKSVVKCSATCTGPMVFLNQDLVNFGKVNTRETTTKLIDMVNDSCSDATYQFQIDCCESVFQIDPWTGTLPANSRKTISIHFTPVYPLNYYRRVACVIHQQGVIYVDVIGTCHSNSRIPAVLQPEHLEIYRLNRQRGLTLNSPEQLVAMIDSGDLEVQECGALAYTTQSGMSFNGLSSEPTAMEEYFNDGYHSDVTYNPPHVSIDTHQVDFGQVNNLQNWEQQMISVSNHTKGTVSVIWLTEESHVFSICPTETDIPPEKSFTFRVTFKPTGPNRFFGSELEGYACYKSMRDFHLTDNRTHFPPWCLTLKTIGHTFDTCSERFLPKFTLDPLKLSMPVVQVNCALYKTVCLTNTGTTPILYNFDKGNCGMFTQKPTKGLINPCASQLFVVKFMPIDESVLYKTVLPLRLNDADKHTQEVKAHGQVETPNVLLDNQGVIYFKPTCVGTASQRSYSVTNVCRLPIYFEWKIKSSDGRFLSVTPDKGIIQPFEKQHHTWKFTPNSAEKHVLKPLLQTWCTTKDNDCPKPIRQFVVRVIAEGSAGLLICKENLVELGPIIIGMVTKCFVTLANEANCNLYYKLVVQQNVCGPYNEELHSSEPTALALNNCQGMIPARTTIDIEVTVFPQKRVNYMWNINYSIHKCNGECIEMIAPRHICQIMASGVYPTFSVTDIRGFGSAMCLSKKHLWNLFSIERFNLFLDGDPLESELEYSVPTRNSDRRKFVINTRAITDFNFSAAPVDSEPCVIQLTIENNAPVPCEWSFLYPTDLQLDLDYWTETGEYDADELHEMKVLDNKLFTIEPRAGRLDSCQCCTIKLTYLHRLIGTNRLPVLLKLNRGREILINFIGVTIEPDRRYIHFPGTKFMFAPVPIGDTRAPTQVYEMYNGGAVPVKYEIDTLPLQAMLQENYNHLVMECYNPKGEICPGQMAAVEWKFSPLEARTYTVDLAISVDGGETTVVTFTGVGFDKRVMGDTMPLTDQTDYTAVPCVQRAFVPGQLCYLSQERLSFGNVPLYTKTRRLVVLNNCSGEHTACYSWHVMNNCDSQYVRICPVSGMLAPGKSIICHVTFLSFGVPSFYNVGLICEITNLTEQNAYKHELNIWHEEKQRQLTEFKITEANPNADLNVPQPEECWEENCANPCENVEILRYRTLPPIFKPENVQDVRISNKLKRRFNQKFWQKPRAPKPFVLHLGLTARTYDLVEYQQHFPGRYRQSYIDKSLSTKSALSEKVICTVPESTPPVECKQDEADLLSLTLNGLIRNLLDDDQFHEACMGLICEPIPYFQQFTSARQVGSVPVMVEDEMVPDVVTNIDVNGNVPDEPVIMPSNDIDPIFEPSVRVENQSESPLWASGNQIPNNLSDDPNDASFTEEERKFQMKQKIKKLPEFGSMAESLIENTLFNIIQEAFHQEFNITARPRLVALPPKNAAISNF